MEPIQLQASARQGTAIMPRVMADAMTDVVVAAKRVSDELPCQNWHPAHTNCPLCAMQASLKSLAAIHALWLQGSLPTTEIKEGNQ